MEDELEVINIVRFALVQADGDILNIGECREDELSLQGGDGLSVMIGVPEGVTDESHYVKNSSLKAYPAKPGDWAVFNHSTEAWVDTRSANQNDDFDRNHYDISPVITASGNVLSISAFVAARDNGVYAQTKNRSAANLTLTGSVGYAVYSWDANTLGFRATLESTYEDRIFLLGEFRQGGIFIPAQNLIDGSGVATNTVGSEQVRPLAIQGSHLSVGNFDNLVLNPQFESQDNWTFFPTNGQVSITSGVNNQSAKNVLLFTNLTAATYAVYESSISCFPNDEFQVGCSVRGSGTSPVKFTPYIRADYRLKDGSTSFNVINLAVNTTVGFSPRSVSFIAPANAISVKFRWGRRGDMAGETNGAYIENPFIYRKKSGAEIKSNEIITEHLVGRSVTDVYHLSYSATNPNPTIVVPASADSQLYIFLNVSSAAIGNPNAQGIYRHQYRTVITQKNSSGTTVGAFTLSGETAAFSTSGSDFGGTFWTSSVGGNNSFTLNTTAGRYNSITIFEAKR